MRDAFLKLDVDRSGYISQSELKEMCFNWGLQLSEQDFMSINASYPHQESANEVDKGINYNEFIAMMTQLVNYNPGEGESRLENSNTELSTSIRGKFLSADVTMKEAFRQFDKDSSGSIDKDEVHTLLKSFGITYTSEQFSDLVNKFDKNGDNSFQYHEFVKILQGAK